MSTFAKRLRAARLDAGLTQQQIADLFTPALSRNAVSNWENGADMPDPQRLVTIARAVKKSVDFLLTGRASSMQATLEKFGQDSETWIGRLLDIYNELNPDRRRELFRYASLLHVEQHPERRPNTPDTAVHLTPARRAGDKQH